VGTNCAPCKARAKKTKYYVKLAGGLKIERPNEAAALAYSAKHPGSVVIKPGE
jgi:hypothetical protein